LNRLGLNTFSRENGRQKAIIAKGFGFEDPIEDTGIIVSFSTHGKSLAKAMFSYDAVPKSTTIAAFPA